MTHSGLIVHPASAREAELKTWGNSPGAMAPTVLLRYCYGIAGEQTIKSWGRVESLTYAPDANTRCITAKNK
jgi:hypothetical protein